MCVCCMGVYRLVCARAAGSAGGSRKTRRASEEPECWRVDRYTTVARGAQAKIYVIFGWCDAFEYV